VARYGKRPWVLSLCVAVLVCAVFEVLSAVALRILETKDVRYEPRNSRLLDSQRELLEKVAHGGSLYLDLDPVLGWSPKPLAAAGQCRANAAGLRADREYSLDPPDGVRRVVAFGDSFVHGDESDFKDTWGQQLESMVRGLELVNGGVGAYGVDQAYLRYQLIGRRYRARVVIIGFMTDDIGRATNTFRPFHTRRSLVAMAKPRFVLESGRLRLIPNPMPTRADYAAMLEDERSVLDRVGASDLEYQSRYQAVPFDFLRTVRVARLGWWRFQKHPLNVSFTDPSGVYDTGSEAFRLNLALIDAFVAEVREAGSEPLVVLFPGKADLNPSHAREQNRGPIYEPLRVALEARGTPTIDLYPALQRVAREQSVADLFHWSHYSTLGHEIVARTLANRLAPLLPAATQNSH
jgi:lysophospholipase L1-like esterase